MAQERRTLDAAEQIAVQHEVQRHPARQRDDAHQEFGGEAVPDRQAIFGWGGADHSAHGSVENGPDRQRGGDADDKADENENLGREPHQEGGSWGVRGRPVGAGPKNTSRMKRSE